MDVFTACPGEIFSMAAALLGLLTSSSSTPVKQSKYAIKSNGAITRLAVVPESEP